MGLRRVAAAHAALSANRVQARRHEPPGARLRHSLRNSYDYGPCAVVARRLAFGSVMTSYKHRLRRKRAKQNSQKKKDKARAGKKKAR